MVVAICRVFNNKNDSEGEEKQFKLDRVQQNMAEGSTKNISEYNEHNAHNEHKTQGTQ